MKKIKTRKEKLKKNKKQLLILSMIILIITTIHVNAGTEDSNLVKNFIDGIYAIAKLPDRTHIYQLDIYQVNGKTAYCIELGTDISSTVYNSTTDLSISGLSNEKIEYIQKIMYFGYDYKNHEDYQYYMAAQEMIWEYISGVEVYWTHELNINGQAIDIDSYKNEILTLMKQNEIIPSFNGKNYRVLAGSTATIFDSNYVLEEYEITSVGSQKYTISNSRLYVETNKNVFQTDEIIVTRKNYYTNDTVLYYNNSSQKLMSVGRINMPTAKCKVITVGGVLNFELVDSETKENLHQGQASLTGATYEIYDENNNLVTTFTTREGETNKIENLPSQKYYIKQVVASPGYTLNDEVIGVEVNSLNKNVTLEEKIIKSKVEILKIYGDKNTNEYQSETGINFNIYDNLSNLYQTITTNELGYTETVLLYGSYTIKQENTTQGYNKIQDISLTIDENSEETIRYNLFDDMIKIKINVTTKDNESDNKILENNIKYKLKDKITDKYVSYNEINIFDTNEFGQALIPIELPYGTYSLEQVSTPKSYLKNKEVITIVVDDSSNLVYDEDEGLILNVDYYNEIIKGIVHITTNEEQFELNENDYLYETIPRPNIELELYAKEDIITPDGITQYIKGDTIETLTTNEEGKIDTSNLYLGEYCLKEINDSAEDYCFTLENTNNKTSIIEKNVTLTTKINKYNVILTNLDEENGNVIKGTVIELYTEDNKLINTSITNEDGIIKIVDLPKGKYYFKQKSIADNYIIKEDSLYLEVVDQNLDLTITNIKTKTNNFLNIHIPNTLSNNSHLIEILSISSIALGILIYVFKKKYHKHNSN